MAANNNIVVLGESILSFLSAENGGKPLGGRGSVANPALGAHVQRSPDPLSGGEELAPKNFSPLSTFGLDFRPVDLNCPSKQCKILSNPLISYL